MEGFINHRGVHRRAAGYLLLEVVLALGISAIVVGAVFSLASGALSISETASTIFSRSTPADSVSPASVKARTSSRRANPRCSGSWISSAARRAP